MSQFNQSIIEILPRLKNFAFKLTNNKHDAEDLLQDTILKALDKENQFIVDSNIWYWCSKIMYNHFVSSYNRKRKYDTQYDPDIYLLNEIALNNTDDVVKLKELIKIYSTLETEDQVLVYNIIIGNGYEECAKILNVPRGTIASRLSKIRKDLNEKFR